MSRIVIALGGNALGNTPAEQERKIDEACPALVGLISEGHEIIISHGNGPQVGMISLAFEKASGQESNVPSMPLPECTAMSQGYIGYHLQKGIYKELLRRNMPWQVASVVTQTLVDPHDSAFFNPTKPIGAFYGEESAKEMMRLDPKLQMKEDSGRGWRRVVPSPSPIDIVEKKSILNLLDNEYIVIASGGGGIPVIKNADGSLSGVDAVIDKDFASAKLAEVVGADYLFILTAVERVCIDFGKPNEKELYTMTVSEAEAYTKEGHFAQGSMRPKVEAAISFVKSGSERRAVIASLEKAPEAMRGESGTLITL